MNILIYFSVLLSLSVTSSASSSRAPLIEVDEVHKSVTSLETLHEIMLRRHKLERGLHPDIAGVRGFKGVKSMRRPQTITLPITEAEALKNARERTEFIFAGVLCVPERLRMIGSSLSYDSEDFRDFPTLTYKREDFEKFSIFRDISRLCLVSKLWNRAFNNQEFLVGCFPELENIRLEECKEKSPLGILKIFNDPCFSELAKQRNAVVSAARTKALENVLCVTELLMHIGASVSYEAKEYEEFWKIDDIKKFSLVSKLWNRTFNDKDFLVHCFPRFGDVRPEDYGFSTLLRALNFFNKPRFISVGWQSAEFSDGIGRVSDNGAAVCYHNFGFDPVKWNLATRKKTVLHDLETIVDLSKDGEIILGHTRNSMDPSGNKVALWKNKEAEPEHLPFKKAYGLSPCGQVSWVAHEDNSNGGKLIKHTVNAVEEIDPMEEVIDFTPHRLLRDGETVLGYVKFDADPDYQAAIWRNGMIESLQTGFKWLNKGVLRDQRFIGRYNGKVSEYKDAGIERLPIDEDEIIHINDDLMVCCGGSKIWKDGHYFDAKQLVAKTGYKFNEKDTVKIMDVSQNNRIFVGAIRAADEHCSIVFAAVLPSHLFQVQN